MDGLIHVSDTQHSFRHPPTCVLQTMFQLLYSRSHCPIFSLHMAINCVLGPEPHGRRNSVIRFTGDRIERSIEGKP